MRPALEIVTRHMPERAGLLARLKASLATQTSDFYVHTVIVDEVGVGINHAGDLLVDHAPQGEYVWVLDDDDYLLYEDAIRQIVDRLEVRQPDMLIVRFDHGPHGVMPDRYHWMRKPVEGRIGGSSVIASADLWELCRDAWGGGRYETDYDYIRKVYDKSFVIDWFDICPAGLDKQRRGAA